MLDDKERQERATADKLEAEAGLAKLNELKARAQLAKELRELGVALVVTERGEIHFFPEERPSTMLPDIFTPDEQRLLGMVVDITLPDLGALDRDLKEITLTKWLCEVGDLIEQDQPIFEIETEVLDAEIPAPTGGVLSEILVSNGSTIQTETVVGRIRKR